MSVQLVTVEQVSNALRLDLASVDPSDDEGDAERLSDIELKIAQATDAVLDYLKLDADDPYFPWTAETVPGRVSAAIILAVKSLYDDSAAGELLKGLSGGDLSNPVVALLYRLRDPAVA